jgi:raffinose/stachyose/melibiose transport system substrate-binding protein
MKKKILSLILVTTMALGLTACSSTEPAENKDSAQEVTKTAEATDTKDTGKTIEIEFVQVKREAGDTYTKLIEKFNETHPNIKITQNVIPDAQEVLMTRASADNLPDMFNHWPTDAQYAQFAKEGLLLDQSGESYISNIAQNYTDALKDEEGHLYIVPYNMNYMGLFYNVDKFKEAGFEEPKTWSDLINIAEQIKEKGETAFLLPNKDAWTVSQLWSNIESKDIGGHKELYDKMDNGETSFVQVPEYKTALEKMIQLLDFAEADSLALGYDQAINDFANGNGWMFIQGNWALPSMKAANPDFNVAMIPLPNDNGNMIQTTGADSGFCINAKMADDPDKLAAIEEFIGFLVSTEGAQLYTDLDQSPSCVNGVTLNVPELDGMNKYIEANGAVLDTAVLPTGFEDTKRGKIQNVLIDKDTDAFLAELSDDYKQAVSEEQ